MWPKFKAFLALSLTAVLFSCGAAHASQNAVVLPTTSPYPGLTMLANINSAFNTFQTNFSGSTAPSSPATWQFWLDSTNSLMKIYNGSAWEILGKSTANGWIPVNAGVIDQAPISSGSANAYVVTYSPAATAYVVGVHYPFIANFQDTGASTENVNGLGAKALKKQGTLALASADIASGAFVDTVYDGVNLQIASQLGNAAAGSVTNVTCGTGLSGGSITTSGTCSLATVNAGQILANLTGSAAVPLGTSASAIMDNAFGTTQGSTLYRGASTWAALPVGTSGQALVTQGASQNPVWKNQTETLIQTQTASNSASISFTNIPSGYDQYILRYTWVIPQSITSVLQFQVGNPTVVTANYVWSCVDANQSSSGSYNGNGNDAGFNVSVGGVDTVQGVSGVITFMGLSGSGNTVFVEGSSAYIDGSGTMHNTVYGGRNGSVGAPFTVIRALFFSSGNITSGTFSLYGVMNH